MTTQDNTSTNLNNTLNQMSGDPLKFISVYIASKLQHAQKLHDMQKNWPRIRFTANWVLREVGKSSFPDQGNRPARHWLRDNKEDILRSDAFVVWGEPLDELKGAIYEAGFANAHGKPVYVIGQNRSYSKWQMDQGIIRVGSLEQCFDLLTGQTKYQEVHKP